MKYNQKIIAKNGQEILIRNAEASDGDVYKRQVDGSAIIM